LALLKKRNKEVNRKYTSPTSLGRLEEPNVVENGKGEQKGEGDEKNNKSWF